MIEAKDVTSFELGKSLPKNLFLWPKYLWINDPSQKQATILRSKSCHDCPFDAYPALTRKEIKKRIEKFISTMPDASGKYAVGRLLKKAGLLPLEQKYLSKTPDELLNILLEVIDIRNTGCLQ